MRLAEVWRRLEEDTRITAALGRVQRRIEPAGKRNFFLGLEMPSRYRMLILRVSTNSVKEQPDVPESRGLVVRVATRGDESDEAEVELVLTDAEHANIFDMLVRDLVGVAEQPQEESVGLTRFLARLSDWQDLFRRLASRGLSRESQQGLWGELWVMREVVAPVVGFRGAVNAWSGPLGGDQDFQLGATCIEVKSSVANRLDRLVISSERQLEVPGDVVLLLVALSLDSRVNHGETLPEMVDAVRAAASESGCLNLFHDRLEQFGYADDDASMYVSIGYAIRSFQAYRVEERFPKITSTDLQPGISDVHYSLSLGSCRPFKIDETKPAQLLEGLS